MILRLRAASSGGSSPTCSYTFVPVVLAFESSPRQMLFSATNNKIMGQQMGLSSSIHKSSKLTVVAEDTKDSCGHATNQTQRCSLATRHILRIVDDSMVFQKLGIHTLLKLAEPHEAKALVG
ncbi:unnamed protein product [Phytophthora fragariaefolia]|uniref:Unnamed protein product n=1 Tax=Phytophthora fragariaefolia TaxID=1490495 RepID=A0A9W6U4U8_9STRA|nr:unnamed protein product [Phytophthora fragariaefolia]